jgi:hypothetical protein
MSSSIQQVYDDPGKLPAGLMPGGSSIMSSPIQWLYDDSGRGGQSFLLTAPSSLLAPKNKNMQNNIQITKQQISKGFWKGFGEGGWWVAGGCLTFCSQVSQLFVLRSD